MEHEEAVRLQMTEQYLLNELSPEAREEFEEHYFVCHECAIDVGAGATFVDQSKNLLAEQMQSKWGYGPVPPRSPWPAWLRPALVAPVFAVLVAVVGYQNLVSIPQLIEARNHPGEVAWTTVNIGTLGSDAPVVPVRAGQGFMLLLRIPPQGNYSRYTADLIGPEQEPEGTVTLP